MWQTIESFENLPGWWEYWTDINARINSERRNWHLEYPDLLMEHVRTTEALLNACESMGVDWDSVLDTITIFVNNKGLADKPILHLVEHGDWQQLAKTLSSDVRDLTMVTPIHLRHNIPILQKTIEAVVDTYFDRNRMCPYDYRHWTPKDATVDLSIKLKDPRTNKHRAFVTERSRVVREAAHQYKKLVDEYAAVHFTPAFRNIDPRVRDVLGREFRCPLADAEWTNKYARQNKAWEKLVNSLKPCDDGPLTYRDGFGGVDTPIDPRFWFDWPE